MHIVVKCLTGLVVLVMVVIAGMAAAGFCPPAGPWPQPPWCSAPGQVPGMPDLPFPQQPVYGEAPAARTGTPMTVAVEAVVPATQDPVTLTLNGNQYPMERVTDYYYRYPAVSVAAGEQLQYAISAGSRKTATVTTDLNSNKSLRAGVNWADSSIVAKPVFIKGHILMDAGGYITQAARSGSIASTFDAMKEDGGGWAAYDYYWAYKNTSAPEIVDEKAADLKNAADEDSIGALADAAHKRGMKFFLITELEWTVMPGEFPTADNDAYMKYQQEKWTDGQKTVQVMADRLSKDPSDPEANAYWDRWFDQFGKFMKKSATIAQDHDIEMLALGKQIDGAMIPANEKRWRVLIADVRQVYDGKLTQVLYTNEWSDHASQVPWADDLDLITIYYYNRFSDGAQPSVSELAASMEACNRKQFDPLYAKYKKPLIFLLPFQSRDHAATQQWFEPMATAPAVQQDLIGQADLYEAFFISTLDEPWMGGAMTWGYWIEPGFNPKWSFEKSSSVRSKPSSLVVRKWFGLVSSA